MPKKQKSGLYRSKVRIGTDPNGKPIDKWISGKTKKELEEQRQQVIAYYIEQTATETDRLFGDYAVEWYKTRKEPFISASSRAAYCTMINRYVLPAFGERHLRAIRAVEIQTWLNGFAGQSKTQITLAMSVLRGIYRDALADRLVTFDPTAAMRRPQATAPAPKKAFTPQECERIEQTIATHAHGLYLATLYYTGMRQGEVRGLMWGDIDFEAGMIHVQRDIDDAAGGEVGKLKTHAADRYVPMTNALRALMLPHRGLPSAFVFVGERSGNPLSQASARRVWLGLMLACGMATHTGYERKEGERYDIRKEYTTDITPHTFRHNFITMCWNAGMDAAITQKIVGHTDYRTTINIYTHLSKPNIQSAQVALEQIFGQKSCTKVAQAKTPNR